MDFESILPWLLLGIVIVASAILFAVTRRQAKAKSERSQLEYAVTLQQQKREAEASLERMSRHHELASQQAHLKFVEDFLPNLEALLNAIRVAEQTDVSPDDVAKGLHMVMKELKKTLLAYDITPIAPEPGDEFDPEVHEAIGYVETRGVPEEAIAKALRTGWRHPTRLLQPALVQIAREPSEIFESEKQPLKPQVTIPVVGVDS